MQKSSNRSQAGVSLLEMVLALTIFSVVVLAASMLMSSFGSQSRSGRAGLDFIKEIDKVYSAIESKTSDISPDLPTYPSVDWSSGSYIELLMRADLSYRYYLVDAGSISARSLIEVADPNTAAELIRELSSGVLWADASLEDFDDSGGVDATDQALLDACLATDPLTEANCSAVGPVFGVGKDGKTVNFSFRSKQQKDFDKRGFTKTVSLYEA